MFILNRTFLFITANDNEYSAFRARDRKRFVSEKEKTFGNGIVCWYGTFGNYKVWHHHLGKQGVGSQQIIEDAIGYIKPDAVILVGITCGNKNKQEQNIGNILFSEMIIDHSSYKEDKYGKIIPRGGIHTCSPELFGIFDARRLEFMSTYDIKVFKGQIITFSVKMDNHRSIKKIFDAYSNEPIGYEMEGFYAVRACRQNPIVFLVKGVSDFGDGAETGNKKEESQKLAANNAVDFCHYVFSKDGLGGIRKIFYPPSVETPHKLPERNEFFSGREQHLADIHNLFAPTNQIDVINICQTVSGLGGVGKTQLAVEYAYRYNKDYTAIWFVIAESASTIYIDFKKIAEQFKISLPQDFKPEELQWAIKGWLTENEGWLIIFDNLETDDTIIKPYLPDNINGHYIITTRNARIDIETHIDLGVFDLDDEALPFLRRRFSKNDELNMENYKIITGSNDFEEQAPILAERLGLLPLALEQAAAYITIERITITDYLKKLEEKGLKPLSKEHTKPTDYKSIVTATWEISFEKLKKETQWLLNLCAYMAPDKIPMSFFYEMREKLSPELDALRKKLEDNKEELATDLRHYSLASGDAYYINIHRLVQEVVRESHERCNIES